MSLQIEVEKSREVAVLQCTGRIVRNEALPALRKVLTSLSHLRVIVLDLSEVEMLDASGLGVLVSLHNWTFARGIQLKLVNPSTLLREMLELTGLTSVFHISSVDDVIEIFCCPDRAIENIENMERAVA
jgi:anti-anti-sigma factor